MCEWDSIKITATLNWLTLKIKYYLYLILIILLMDKDCVHGSDTPSLIADRTTWPTLVWNIVTWKLLLLMSDEDLRNPPHANFKGFDWSWLSISDEDIRQEPSPWARNIWEAVVPAGDWNADNTIWKVEDSRVYWDNAPHVGQSALQESTIGAVFISDEDLRHIPAPVCSSSQMADWSWLKISDEDLR